MVRNPVRVGWWTSNRCKPSSSEPLELSPVDSISPLCLSEPITTVYPNVKPVGMYCEGGSGRTVVWLVWGGVSMLCILLSPGLCSALTVLESGVLGIA